MNTKAMQLPGVGLMNQLMFKLKNIDWSEVPKTLVHNLGVPVISIMLFLLVWGVVNTKLPRTAKHGFTPGRKNKMPRSWRKILTRK